MSSSSSSPPPPPPPPPDGNDSDVNNRIDRLESSMSRLEGMLSMFIQGIQQQPPPPPVPGEKEKDKAATTTTTTTTSSSVNASEPSGGVQRPCLAAEGHANDRAGMVAPDSPPRTPSKGIPASLPDSASTPRRSTPAAKRSPTRRKRKTIGSTIQESEGDQRMAKRKRSGKPVAADIITTEASDAVDTGIGTSSTQAVTDHNCCGSNSGTAELPHGGQSTDVVAVVGYESTNTVPNGVYTPVVVPPGSGQEEEDSTSMLPIQWPDTLQDAAVAVRASTTKLTDTKEENIPPAVSPSSPWLTWEEVIGLNLKEEEEESGGINTVTAEVVPDDNKPDTSQLSSSKPIPASVTEGDDRKGPEDEEEEEESGGNLFPDESDSSPVVAAPVEPTQPASAAPSTQPTSPALNAKEKKREWFQALYSNDGAKAAPCRYYAQGRCTKGDACPYSHDDAAAAKLRKAHHDALAAIPCKFHVVLGHGCREGDACRYSHQVERFPCVRQSITGHCGGGPSQCPMLHYPVAVRQTEAFKMWVVELYSGFMKERIEGGDQRVTSLWSTYFTDTIMSDPSLHRNFDHINTYIAERATSSVAANKTT